MPNSVREVTTPATSVPILGAFASNEVSMVFTPQLGRNMYLTLEGTWAGSVQVKRSVNGGRTWNTITIGGGQPSLVFTTNCDEIIDYPTDAAATYRLEASLISGAVSYRLAQ